MEREWGVGRLRETRKGNGMGEKEIGGRAQGNKKAEWGWVRNMKGGWG